MAVRLQIENMKNVCKWWQTKPFMRCSTDKALSQWALEPDCLDLNCGWTTYSRLTLSKALPFFFYKMRMQKKKKRMLSIFTLWVWELNTFIYIKLLKQSWKAVFSSIEVRCDNIMMMMIRRMMVWVVVSRSSSIKRHSVVKSENSGGTQLSSNPGPLLVSKQDAPCLCSISSFVKWGFNTDYSTKCLGD